MSDILTHRIRIGIFNGKVRSSRFITISTQSPSTKTKHKYKHKLAAFLLVLFWIVITCIETDPNHTIHSPHASCSMHRVKPVIIQPIHAARLEQMSEPVEPHSLSRKQRNKLANSRYGNKQVGIKLAHWNAGGKLMENKMNEIESLVSALHPECLGISESNLKSCQDMTKVQLPGYQLFTSKTINNPELNISRVVVYIKDRLNCKLREDLMDDSFSSVWVEIKAGKQKFLVANIYREHQYMNQDTDQSLGMDQQLLRWILFLEQWRKALATGIEVHALGDYNICSLSIHSQNGEKQCLVDQLIQKILPEGVTQCVQGATRFPQGAQRHSPAGLDHFWTSAPEKLSEVQVMAQGSSDHSVIFATRITREGNLKQEYIKKRDFSSFNERGFLAEIKSINWMCVYSCENVDTAVQVLTDKISDILNRKDMAPVKMFQPRDHYAPWLSDETKIIMGQRDNAQTLYNSSLSAENWESYRQLRNSVTRRLRNEKVDWMKAKIQSSEHERDARKTWQNVLGWLGWSKNQGGPTKLVNPATSHLETSPRKVVKIINEFYVTKVKRIRDSLPKIGDPLKTLRALMAGRQSIFSFKPVHPDEINKIRLS